MLEDFEMWGLIAILVANVCALWLLVRHRRAEPSRAPDAEPEIFAEGYEVALDTDSNAAEQILKAARDMDVLALVSCKVSEEERSGGIISQELTIRPCFSSRTGKIEPCMVEVARGLRFLADRLDEQTHKAGY